jgi:hypothetical protein
MTEADRIIADLKRLEPTLRSERATQRAILGSRAPKGMGPEAIWTDRS